MERNFFIYNNWIINIFWTHLSIPNSRLFCSNKKRKSNKFISSINPFRHHICFSRSFIAPSIWFCMW